MAVSARMYRSLLRLYPSEFRHEFGIDLALHFDDLVADLGTGRAWRRTAIDLTVTIPRYRLEHHMSEQHAASTTILLVGASAAGSAFAVLIGFYPIAPVLLLIGLWLFLSRRGALAAAVRVPDSSRRLRRFKIAGALAVVFVVSVLLYLLDLQDDEISSASLLTLFVGTSAMVGAVVFGDPWRVDTTRPTAASDRHLSGTVTRTTRRPAKTAGTRTANRSPSGVQKPSLVNRSRCSPRQISNDHTMNTTVEGDHTMNQNTSRIAAALAAAGLLAAVTIGS